MKDNLVQLPENWRRVPLRCVATVNPRRPATIDRKANCPTSFVPMQAVDDELGKILHPETRPFEKVKHGYTYFENGDVLFAKITPSMQNGKHAIATNLIDGIGFGTTEFHVVKPSSALTSQWLHYFLRYPTTLKWAELAFTGSAGQQRVPPKFLEELLIPVPPLEEQKRIAAILDNAFDTLGKLRAASRQQTEAVYALIDSHLREIFGSQEARRWPRKRFEQLGELASGGTPRRGNPQYFGGSIPWIKTTDLNFSYIRETEETITEVGLKAMNGDLVPKGSVLIAMYGGAGTIGKSGIAGCSAAINQSICAIYPNSDVYIPEYLHYWVMMYRPHWMKHSSGNRKDPNVNKQIIAMTECPLPSLERQKAIVDSLDRVKAIQDVVLSDIQKQNATIELLPASILRQAFRGEL